MAGQSFLTILATGAKKVLYAIQVSAGVSSAGQIPALNANGTLDQSFMPGGVGPESVIGVANGAISAGSYVNYYSNGGTLTLRLADNTTGLEAMAYAPNAIANAASGTVYSTGVNTALSGLTVGAQYWLGAAGAPTAVVPSTIGYLLQELGVASSTTALPLAINPSPVTL